MQQKIQNIKGQSKIKLTEDFCGHRSDIKKLISNTSDGEAGGTKLLEHFSSSPHLLKDLRVRILDSTPRWRDIDQLTMEDYYIYELKTIKPDGLNVRHGTFAKFYYNQFQPSNGQEWIPLPNRVFKFLWEMGRSFHAN